MKRVIFSYAVVLLAAACTSPQPKEAAAARSSAAPVVLEARIPPKPWVDPDRDDVSDRHDFCPDSTLGTRVGIDGCLSRSAQWIRQVSLGMLNFASGSAQIETDRLPWLDRLAVAMNDYPGVLLDLTGHADATGSDELNHALSERRAAVIRDYLIGKGVAARRLNIAYQGEAAPAASNDTLDGRATNRRVELLARRP